MNRREMLMTSVAAAIPLAKAGASPTHRPRLTAEQRKRILDAFRKYHTRQDRLTELLHKRTVELLEFRGIKCYARGWRIGVMYASLPGDALSWCVKVAVHVAGGGEQIEVVDAAVRSLSQFCYTCATRDPVEQRTYKFAVRGICVSEPGEEPI